VKCGLYQYPGIDEKRVEGINIRNQTTPKNEN
jgi:hypothetical protein